jgi:hypothetical protein
MGLEIRTVVRGGGLRATIERVRPLARLNFGELGDDLEAFRLGERGDWWASIDSAPSHAVGRRSARATPLIQGITRWKSVHSLPPI